MRMEGQIGRHDGVNSRFILYFLRITHTNKKKKYIKLLYSVQF